MGAKPIAGLTRLALGAIVAAAVPAGAAAVDTPPLILEHLTASDGLPQSTVYTTLQDSQGFIWLGTEDGLIRYDGDELVRYAYSPSARGGLPGNYIYQVVEDSRHDLWVAIKDAGLARWNRATDDFTVYRHVASDPNSLASDAVRALLVDAHGRVWVGTSDAGIDILDPGTGRAEHLRHDPANPGSLIDDQVFTLALDHAGNLWVGTERGLDRWDPVHHRFLHFSHASADSRSLSGNEVSRVFEDRSGTLWIGTFDGGLTRMSADGHVAQTFRHDPRQPASLGSDDVRAILEDRAGHLWVGTEDGLDLLDRATGTFNHYRHDPSDAESLRDSFIMSLYEDDTGLVWIGTFAGGVSRWNPRSWELGGHQPGWLNGKFVTAFADAPKGQVWIASAGAGLARFDPESGQASSIDALVGRRNSLDRRVMSLREDRRGTLWIGTMTSGLWKLSAEGQLQPIPIKPHDPHGTSAAGIMSIFQAHDGRIWVGTAGGGLNILDPETGLVRQLPFGSSAPGAISTAAVRAITEDLQGNFWIGTDGGGLDLVRPDGYVIAVYRHDSHDQASLPANTVYALAVDARNRIWVATDGGGLALVTGSAQLPGSIHFKSLSSADGLSSDTIYGVLSDSGGRLWLSGNAGLMRVDPDTGSIKTFHREDGLQGEEFDTGAYYRLRDGRLCFGGLAGFNIFDPSRLTEPRQPPGLVLSQVDVLGVPMSGPTPNWLLTRIALDYQANIVSLGFGVLDFSSPKRNRIAYRMAGLTDRWIDLGTQHRINLTNLEAGDHLLEVRAANSDSVWSPTLRLMIHRDPAPWKSKWAYSAYALAALALLVYGLSRQRAKFRRVVRERQRLEAEVELRTRELVDSNRQLAEAVQVKSQFLDRMSHELRTPMNGVLGMAELLTHTPLSSTQARLTRTIRSSARILVQIVNDLLDLSKVKAGKLQLEELPIDIVGILEECTDLFAAQTKGIDLIACPPARDWPNLVGDPLRVRQILTNLTANAVKFTEQGTVVVKADIQSADAGGAIAVFTVADTGIGMDASTIDRIFEPFTQADESTTRRFGGSGLGLAICRELAELMGGTIRVESQPQLGSTFYVSVPLKLGPEPPPTPPSLPLGGVRILSRRPALVESLSHHLSALGLTVIPGDQSGSCAPSCEQTIVVDAGTAPDYLEYLRSRDRTAGPKRPALVVVASAAEIESQELQRLVAREAIVLKPVHRDALHDALAAAMGVAAAPTAAAGIVAAAAPLVQDGVGGHVLLVEDEPVNAAVAQGYLTALGCTCVWARDGAQAVARALAERFDLILMDLSMPNMDGFATTTLIRQRDSTRARTPIVALTAHESGTYRETCLAAGMDDMLIKPYTLEQCAELLRRWIARPTAVDASTVARLRTLSGAGQTDLYSQVVELFCTGSTEALLQLRAALEQPDLQAAAAVCHKLASSAANVGALSFAADVRRLEQLCRGGDLQRARSLHPRLAAAHPALIAELLDLRVRESA